MSLGRCGQRHRLFLQNTNKRGECACVYLIRTCAMLRLVNRITSPSVVTSAHVRQLRESQYMRREKERA